MNIFFRSLFLSATLLSVPLFCQMQQVGESYNMDQGMDQMGLGANKMPSVSQMFEGLSEDELVSMVNDAQKEMQEAFSQMTPEEIAAFEKQLENTMASMSEEDLKTIQDIASHVEDKLDPIELKQKDEEKVEEKPKEKIKKDSPANSTIQKLIDNINFQIDDILLKVKGSKDLAEEFGNKWSNKVIFENMKSKILGLKQDRFAKKLTDKTGQEDKELFEKLNKFHKNLVDKNSDFEVEDLFGLAPSNKSELKQMMKQGREIISMFNESIDGIMPAIEKFLLKHDPEALKMAKDSEARKKKAAAHEKDSNIRHGSAAAPISQGGSSRYQTSTSQPSSTAYPSYGGYDDYGYPDSSYGGYNRSFGDKDYDDYNRSFGDIRSQQPQQSLAEKDKKFEAPLIQQHQQNKSDGDYDDAIDDLNELYEVFERHHKQISQLLDNFAVEYPDATDQKFKPNNKDQQDNWLHSNNEYAPSKQKAGGYESYDNLIQSLIGDIERRLQEVTSTLHEIKGYVTNVLSRKQLEKIKKHKILIRLEKIVFDYEKKFNKGMAEIDKKFQANIGVDNAEGPIGDKVIKQMYEKNHKLLMKMLSERVGNEIDYLKQKIEELKRRINRHIKKKK